MAAMPSEEASIVEAVVNAIVHYGPVSALLAILGFVWKGSSTVKEYGLTQDEHEKKLSDHHAEIAALKASDAATRVTIAGLPTRLDLSELREEMRTQTAQTQAQMQSGFDNLSRMISRRE